MQFTPLYAADNQACTHNLVYTISAYPKHGGPRFPASLASVSDGITAHWRRDGFALLELTATKDCVEAVFRVEPHVDPITFTGRVKGRLQHACRQEGFAAQFSMKTSFRAIGPNTGETVENYLANQVDKEQLCDPAYEDLVRKYTQCNEAVDLSLATETRSGRYWYNLHIVLVLDGRH